MKYNLPANVRTVVYVVVAILSPTMAYLNTAGTVSDFAFGLFSVVVTAVMGLATINVTSDK